MKSTKQRIDEQGNILLPREYLNCLGWGMHTMITATLSANGAVVLKSETRAEGGAQHVMIDALGRVVIARTMREKLGWQHIDTGDLITVMLHKWESKISLRLAEKYELQCAFCGRPDTVAKIIPIELSGICEVCYNILQA